ncbi:hypothetical protein E2562_004438 [Oryza meyeriana var. granulata]|uniref:Ubiquitin-like protease family profile domain-containing protein n=1 Tax=Oryza meyeriana var. granulata TaxID=110450 RepID=A0A6G1CZD9_9ORYZ|nr:hypothetical protein E2562_004438 [Oryza meyeriana var. granulata]
MALRSMVLADQERYRRCMATGGDIVGSFADGCMMKGIFIDAFATFLVKEEMRDRPQSYGKRIILLVLNNNHWSLYIINFMHKHVDILDSNDYNMIRTEVAKHHGELFRTVTKRLSDGFQCAF